MFSREINKKNIAQESELNPVYTVTLTGIKINTSIY